MVVIANDCVGGELYRLCDEEFKSPFMWTVLPIKDFIELYKNYDNINFKNITYNQTPNYYFSWYMSSLNIDNKVNVYFPHHAKIENNKVFSKFEPVKGQSMCGWDRMDEYIVEHYNRRVDRMVEKPCFIYSQENRNSEDELVELLELANNGYHLIFITSNKELISKYNNCDNIRFLYKEKNEIVQKIQAEAIKNNFMDFVNYK